MRAVQQRTPQRLWRWVLAIIVLATILGTVSYPRAATQALRYGMKTVATAPPSLLPVDEAREAGSTSSASLSSTNTMTGSELNITVSPAMTSQAAVLLAPDAHAGGRPAAAAAPAAPAKQCLWPKVALMFLTRGPLPHSAVWEEWLKGVDGGLLPVPALTRLGCGDKQVEQLRALGAGEPGADASLYQRQRLFSIYVHAPPAFNSSYPPESIFSGRIVRNRVPTKWGTHSLVTAERHMVAEALEDPCNQRFVTVSESDIPIWPAGLTYLQLMAEPASRVHACPPRNEEEQTNLELFQADVLHIPHSQWRKSSQWVVLNRKHATVFLTETKWNAVFEKDCWVRRDMVTWKWRDGDRWCVSDEHYLPFILSVYGHEGGCSCSVALADGLAHVSPTLVLWSGQPHPKTFTAEELLAANASSLKQARGCDPATAKSALRAYREQLVDPKAWTQEMCKRKVEAAARSPSRTTASSPAAAKPSGGRLPDTSSTNAAAGMAPAANFDWGHAQLPPYRSFFMLRKVTPESADPLALAISKGLLEAP